MPGTPSAIIGPISARPPPLVITPDRIGFKSVPMSCNMFKDSSCPVNPKPFGLKTPASDSIARM